MNLAELTIEAAKPLAGTVFEVALPDGGTTQMKLDDALTLDVRQRRRVRGAPTPKREPFSLYFLGEPSFVLPQGMYDFTSEALTLEGLFIVPVGQDDQNTEYEAVFT
jgi:hypothetical protein